MRGGLHSLPAFLCGCDVARSLSFPFLWRMLTLACCAHWTSCFLRTSPRTRRDHRWTRWFSRSDGSIRGCSDALIGYCGDGCYASWGCFDCSLWSLRGGSCLFRDWLSHHASRCVIIVAHASRVVTALGDCLLVIESSQAGLEDRRAEFLVVRFLGEFRLTSLRSY